MIYTEDDMREAFVAGHAAGRYRGKVTAASRLTDKKRRAAESTYEMWRTYAGDTVGSEVKLVE